MKKNGDNSYVSVSSWMAMMVITAIPIIGWCMILVWAFTGENKTRKNYFRAILAWFLISVTLVLLVLIFSGAHHDWQAIRENFRSWARKL